jgi:hypothetical protein
VSRNSWWSGTTPNDTAQGRWAAHPRPTVDEEGARADGRPS